MKWQYEAVDKLKGYQKRKHSIESITEEIEELELEFGSIRSSTSGSEPVQGSSGRSEDALLNNIAKREELKRTLEINKKSMDIIDGALAMLDDDAITVLDCFYIRPRENMEEMCEELGVEQATVYRRKNEALRQFTMALYGIPEV